MGKKIKKQSSPSEMSEVAKGISMILQIGISMIVPVGLCLFLGYKLDTWLNKSLLYDYFYDSWLFGRESGVYIPLPRVFMQKI